MSEQAPEKLSPEEIEEQLIEDVASFYYDPLGYALYNWDWDSPPLNKYGGLDDWQIDHLNRLGAECALRDGVDPKLLPADVQAAIKDWDAPPLSRAVRIAVGSGHGVGKTLLTSIIIHWFMSTRWDPQCIVTANTKDQLTNKTWRELGKMNGMAMNGHWFEHTATKLIMKSRPKSWYATAVPWSEGNSEAFAGTHEQHVMMLFDEASAVADIIWEVAEGAMTTPGAIYLAFGNRTRNVGKFADCFKSKRHRWVTFEVDARTSKVADQAQIQEWIEDFGIESDFVKVRALGQEPQQSAMQLIGANLVDGAVEREIDIRHIPSTLPRLMGADCAAGGSALSVIVRRQGPKMFPDIDRWNIADPLVLGGKFAEAIHQWNPDIFFIDAYGVGLGTYRYLIQLGFQNVVPVYWGDRSLVTDKDNYYNPHIECWDRVREWLRTADIPDDKYLKSDLIGPEYIRDMNYRMRIEKKEEMAKRGIPSPDTADALAVTFFHVVPTKIDHYSHSDLEPEVII